MQVSSGITDRARKREVPGRRRWPHVVCRHSVAIAIILQAPGISVPLMPFYDVEECLVVGSTRESGNGQVWPDTAIAHEDHGRGRRRPDTVARLGPHPPEWNTDSSARELEPGTASILAVSPTISLSLVGPALDSLRFAVPAAPFEEPGLPGHGLRSSTCAFKVTTGASFGSKRTNPTPYFSW